MSAAPGSPSCAGWRVDSFVYSRRTPPLVCVAKDFACHIGTRLPSPMAIQCGLIDGTNGWGRGTMVRSSARGEAMSERLVRRSRASLSIIPDGSSSTVLVSSRRAPSPDRRCLHDFSSPSRTRQAALRQGAKRGFTARARRREIACLRKRSPTSAESLSRSLEACSSERKCAALSRGGRQRAGQEGRSATPGLRAGAK